MKNVFHKYILFMTALALLSGCLDNKGANGPSGTSGSPSSSASLTSNKNPTPTPAPTASATPLSYSIVNGSITSPQGSNQYITTLNFNATNSGQPITNVCLNNGGGTNPPKFCKCRFSWSETSNSGAGYTRTADTATTQVTGFQITCAAPVVYSNEIPDGRAITISVVPDKAQENTIAFTTNTVTINKSMTASVADFRDAEGRSIKNIIHYSCYDKVGKALSISRGTALGSNRTTGNTPTVSLANQFVVSPNADYSAESYYYDFFVRSGEEGSINSANASFECPRFTVQKNGVLSQQYYPQDSQFALALQKSSRYNIAVHAYTTLSLNTNGFSPDVILGYAIKPQDDGSCPAVPDAAGVSRQTYRLRRYTVTYPVRYKADGTILGGTQPTNQLYILDRPVYSSSSTTPLSRLGPKPCPFSLRTASQGYTCTSTLPAGASAINIDGTKISSLSGCPIFPPPATDNLNNGSLEIRPMQPWSPIYLEEADFRACAYPSSAPVDPDIVVVHEDSSALKDFYCAKYYPSHSWIDPGLGSVFTKMPSDCEALHATWTGTQVDPPVGSAASILNNTSYACALTSGAGLPAVYDGLNRVDQLKVPRAGCCSRCVGTGCGNYINRRAASAGQPKLLEDHPRLGRPNGSNWETGCDDPSEDP